MNPFNPKTKSYHDYEIMKDLGWHCTGCELVAGQAKTYQQWRQNYGLQLDKGNPDSNNFDKRTFCNTCNRVTVHRKLLTLDRLEETKSRSGLSQKMTLRVKELFNYREALLQKKIESKDLEVDHKFPQIRWNKDEKSNEDLTDVEIKEKFFLLTRSDNLLKSRACERCVKFKIRGNFPGIYFWYEGDENWTAEPHDEKGCVGCFWYDPYKWREELNKAVLFHKILNK
jgi:hypothetical protein